MTNRTSAATSAFFFVTLVGHVYEGNLMAMSSGPIRDCWWRIGTCSGGTGNVNGSRRADDCTIGVD